MQKSVLFSTSLSLESIGSLSNQSEFEITEIRCWNTCRDSYLLKQFMSCSLPVEILQHYLVLYLPSYCSKQEAFSPCDILNKHCIFQHSNIQMEVDSSLLFSPIQSINKQKELLHHSQAICSFDINEELGGRWYSSWNTGCEYWLYKENEKYSCIIELLDESICFEMTGIQEKGNIVLSTSTLFSYSLLDPPWLHNLQLSIDLQNMTSFSFLSSISQQEDYSILPTTLCFHNYLHSSILQVTTSTLLTNCSDVKQWGMGIAVLRPEDINNSRPIGFLHDCWVWDIKVKRCTTQYMGIGVASLGSKLNSYLGRDFTGWSFQPTGEKWHSNVGSLFYPDKPSYSEGDLISVELDMDNGTLGYYKNHQFIGIAFSHLKENTVVAKYGLFPAVTSYRYGDELELIGLREGIIVDYYNEKENDGIKSIKMNWRRGMRNGYGVIECINGEKQHGIWKNGKCEGMMIFEKNGHFQYKWKKLDEIINATEEQIREFLTSNEHPLTLLQTQPSNLIQLSKRSSKTIACTGMIHSIHQSLFTLSTVNCADGIQLSHSNLKATCTMNNRCMLLGSRCFVKGKAYWEVKIEHCEYGSVFIGIASKLIGSSHQCWRDVGCVNNRSFQDHSIECYYGTQFYQNDIIGVLVDFDVGEISYIKKGKDFYYSHNNCVSFGIASRDLKNGDMNYVYYPSFGFKHAGDCISLVGMKYLESDRDEEEESLQSFLFLQSIQSNSISDQAQQFFKNRYSSLYLQNKVEILVFHSIPIIIDCNQRVLNSLLKQHHLVIGQIIHDGNEKKRIIGCRKNEIWYYSETNHDYWYWYEEDLPIGIQQDWNSHFSSLLSSSSSFHWNSIMQSLSSILSLCNEQSLPLFLFISNNQLLSYSSLSSYDLGMAITILQYINLHSKLILSLHSPLSSLLTFAEKKWYVYQIFSLTSFFYNRDRTEVDRPLILPEIRLNRITLQKAQLAGSSQADLLPLSLFSQLIKNIEVLPISHFRKDFYHVEDAGQLRSFYVRLIGEGVYDSGGPYREIIKTCAGIEPIHIFGMAKLTENCENGLTHTEDMEIVASSHYYGFYWGVLVGIAIRDEISLPFSFTNLFYKQLVGKQVDKYDLIEVDSILMKMIDNWNDSIAMFGSMNELINQLPLNEERKQELINISYQQPQFIQSILLNCLYQQKQEDLKPFLRGFYSVVPKSLCELFSAEEMRELICGKNDISIEDLQRITEYGDGVNNENDTIKRFWRVVECFSMKERRKLLEFVTARSSIPVPPHPPISFKIVINRSNDCVLPQSQTCFSILKLPNYSSDEIMKERLLYAIHHTVTMELDVQLHTAEGWSE